VVVVEYFEAGEESPFAFARGIALTRFVGTTGPRDTFVELEPAEELAVAHCWLEGPIRKMLLQRCVATVSAESLLRIEENREPFAVPDLPSQVASFRISLRQKMNALFRDSWRELYEQIENASEPTSSVEGVVRPAASLGLTRLSEPVTDSRDVIQFKARETFKLAAATDESRTFFFDEESGRAIRVDTFGTPTRCRLYCDPKVLGELAELRIGQVTVSRSDFDDKGFAMIPWEDFNRFLAAKAEMRVSIVRKP